MERIFGPARTFIEYARLENDVYLSTAPRDLPNEITSNAGFNLYLLNKLLRPLNFLKLSTHEHTHARNICAPHILQQFDAVRCLFTLPTLKQFAQ